MFKNRGKCEYDIHLVENKRKTLIEVSGNNEESILTALAVFIKQIKEQGRIETHKIKYAVSLGLGEKDKIPTNIKVQEIHISKENEDEFKKILEKLMKGE